MRAISDRPPGQAAMNSDLMIECPVDDAENASFRKK